MLKASSRGALGLLSALLGLATPAAAEDLRRIVDANAAPFAAIGRLNNGVGGHCTAVLVAQDIVVTAAHCLYNRRTGRWIRPQSVHVLFGYARDRYVHHSLAAAYETGKDYDPKSGAARLAGDFALVTLADPAPASIAPLRAGKAVIGKPHTAVGFARGRPYLMTVSPDCRPLATRSDGILVTDCDTPFGTSGGPLLSLADDTLTGIQVAFAKSGATSGAKSGEGMVSFTVPAEAWAEGLARLKAVGD